MKHPRCLVLAHLSLCACLLFTSCTQSGYKVLQIESQVPNFRLDLREFGPPQADVYFLMGLHCLEPLTIVYALHTGAGVKDFDHYYALVRKDNAWQRVHLHGQLQLFKSPLQYSSPPDGKAHGIDLYSREPYLLRKEIQDSRLPEMPNTVDLSKVDLTNAKHGWINLIRFDEKKLNESLLGLHYALEVGGKEYVSQVFDLGRHEKLIDLKLYGRDMYWFRLSTVHVYKSPRFDSGFLLFQPNFHEVLIFDLRAHWPKFPQDPKTQEPKCIPLL